MIETVHLRAAANLISQIESHPQGQIALQKWYDDCEDNFSDRWNCRIKDIGDDFALALMLSNCGSSLDENGALVLETRYGNYIWNGSEWNEVEDEYQTINDPNWA